MAELKQVVIPDIGDFKDVPVIEVLVKAGDEVKTEDSLVSLESDKATIEIPSPYSGLIKEVLVKPGDKVSQGTLVLVIETSDKDHTETSTQVSADELIRKGAIPPEAEVKQISAQSIQKLPQRNGSVEGTPLSKAHASPSIRRFARELGVNLDLITGSGPKHRILKEDVQAYVKAELSKSQGGGV
ncbi:MAG: biotin/lipoyl-containing protein [Pseudomonadota bacterium]